MSLFPQMSQSSRGLSGSRKIEKADTMNPATLPEIPIYEPTFDEFYDFTKFILMVEELGAHHVGLCKIIPPSGWEARSGGYNDIDDFIVEKPVRQITHGSRGIFLQDIAPMKSLTYKQFRDMASADPYRTPRHRNWEHLEKKYWSSIGTGRPIYGANVSGSLMRGQHIWNIAKLDSILSRVLKSENVRIPGVNTPYLYYGMWRATFPWHVEDIELYSINFVHFGAPKHWYVVPPAFARKFEAFVFEYFRPDFIACPCFLRHKCVLISPSVLANAGIPTRKVVQRSGEFIITFPYAYHAGFNMGLNVAESINFAVPRWIEFGKKAKVCTCWDDTVRISMDPFVRLYQPDIYDDWLHGRDCRPHPLDEYTVSHDEAKHLSTTTAATSDASECLPAIESAPSALGRGSRACRASTSETFTVGDLNLLDLRIPSVGNQQSQIPFHLRHLPFLSTLWCGESPSFSTERYFNCLIGSYPPHCAVCSFLWTPQFLGKVLSSGTPTTVPPPDGVPYIPEVAFLPQNNDDALSIRSPSDRRCQILQCSRCRLTVHASCYGLPESDIQSLVEPPDDSSFLTSEIPFSSVIPNGDNWRCDACSSSTRPTCVLCYIRGGAIKPLKNSVNQATGHPFWVHIVCALANPGCRFVDVPQRVAAVSSEAVARALELVKQNYSEPSVGELSTVSDVTNTRARSHRRLSNSVTKEPLVLENTSHFSSTEGMSEGDVVLDSLEEVTSSIYSEPFSDALTSPRLIEVGSRSDTLIQRRCPQSTTGYRKLRKKRKCAPAVEVCCVCQQSTRGCLPLARCWFANCNIRYHVTCAQMAGVTFGSELYPYLFYLACDSHQMGYRTTRGQFDTDIVFPGDHVIVRLSSNPPELVPAIVMRLVTPRYCRVAFPDGTFSSDTPPEYLDVDWYTDGPPKKGSTVKVLWVDNREYLGSFQGTTPEVWELQLNSGRIVKVPREQFYPIPSDSATVDHRKAKKASSSNSLCHRPVSERSKLASLLLNN